VGEGLERLAGARQDFLRFLERDGFDVGLYKPEQIDTQTPHLRDEIYVIASGRGNFRLGAETSAVAPGDLLFVPAGAEHRFEDFTADFSAWVVFIGRRAPHDPD
jgi:mannose-6-phosphate isomerase-like protein (cupin superfamily)